MTRLLLARHGNTFAPGERAVWLGSQRDLPLVASGEAQARALAEALRAARLVPPAVVSGGLLRTRRTAEIVAAALGLPTPTADRRLDEIDYGGWEGLATGEVDALGPEAAAAQRAWNERDAWPAGAGWLPDETTLRARLADFVAAWRDQPAPAMVVTSAGILRFLVRLLLPETAWDRPSYKMRTGRLGVIAFEDGTARLVAWDVGPSDIGAPDPPRSAGSGVKPTPR